MGRGEDIGSQDAQDAQAVAREKKQGLDGATWVARKRKKDCK